MIRPTTPSGLFLFQERQIIHREVQIRGLEAKIASINRVCDGTLVGPLEVRSSKDLARHINKIIAGGSE